MYKRRLIFFMVVGILGFSIKTYADMQDPTKPADANEISEMANVNDKGLALNAIMFNTQKPIAIINGQAVHVGDTIVNYKVKAIQKEHVELKTDKGDIITLSMPNAVLQRPSN